MSATRERDWQRIVVATARQLGWRTYHTHDSRRSDPGFPDLVMVRERVVFAELKTATGKVSEDQLAWLGKLEAAGAEVYLWRPSDEHEVLSVLKRRRAVAR